MLPNLGGSSLGLQICEDVSCSIDAVGICLELSGNGQLNPLPNSRGYGRHGNVCRAPLISITSWGW